MADVYSEALLDHSPLVLYATGLLYITLVKYFHVAKVSQMVSIEITGNAGFSINFCQLSLLFLNQKAPSKTLISVGRN